MKKTKLIIAGLLAISSATIAQELSPHVIGSAGGIGRTEKISLEWTLGESNVQSVQTRDNLFTEGYQQPYLKVLGVQKEMPENYQIVVAPNPVKSILSFKIYADEESVVSLRLTDLNGKVLYLNKANSKLDSKEIDMSDYLAGIYVLNIRNSSGSINRTYKISKVY
jgi:hypothetical protein